MTKKEKQRWLAQLNRVNQRKLDAQFQEAHENAFTCIDCLECANCCITTGPRLTDADIKRAARFLRIKDVDFVNQYVSVDEDGDQVFKSMPCPFLGADNYCSIYDARPKACREYPHTDRVKQHQLLRLHLANVKICPAVEQVVKSVAKD